MRNLPYHVGLLKDSGEGGKGKRGKKKAGLARMVTAVTKNLPAIEATRRGSQVFERSYSFLLSMRPTSAATHLAIAACEAFELSGTLVLIPHVGLRSVSCCESTLPICKGEKEHNQPTGTGGDSSRVGRKPV
jgi:hypothetical protein